MKLSEIKKALDNISKRDEHNEVYDRWSALPKAKYAELPSCQKKLVREIFSVDLLKNFIADVYNIRQKDLSDDSPSYEFMIQDIPVKELDKIMIKIRNNAVYTMQYDPNGNGKQITPFLYGNFACDAFENAIYEYKNLPKLQPKRRKKRFSANKLVFPYYQSVISDRAYQHALTTTKNKNAYLAIVDQEFFDKIKFENGNVTYNNLVVSTIRKCIKGEYQDISEINFPLLVQIYTIALKEAKTRGEKTITVHYPSFFKSIGTDMKAGNASDVMRQIYSFQGLVGIMPQEQTISSVFQIIEVDAYNETMTFAVPYMDKLFGLLEYKNKKKFKNSYKDDYDTGYELPHYNMLVHSKIISERNKPAIELVYLITTGLLQRGRIPDYQTYRKKGIKYDDENLVTYSTSFRSLLDNAPILKGRVDSYKNHADKNRALQRAFSKAYNLLKVKTDVERYFINLEYESIIPTISTIDNILTVSHHGINKDYKPFK